MNRSTVEITWRDATVAAADVCEQILRQASSVTAVSLYGIPRGGIPSCLLVIAALQIQGRLSFMVEDPSKADFFIDDIVATGNTALAYEKNFEKPFYTLFSNSTDSGEWYSFPWERMKVETGPEENIVRFLEFIGEDPNREGLVETPKRVIASYSKLFGGYKEDAKKILKTFKDGVCDEMVVLRDIEFYSHCEHHIMPFHGKAHIGYIPSDKVVGISKLARLLEVYTRRLQIQERIGQQITETLMEVLSPQGCGCVLEAQHFCMTSRGVQKQGSIMVSSSMRGNFREASVKDEFFRTIGK